MNFTSSIFIALSLCSSSLLAGTINPENVPSKKQTPQQLYITPQEAYNMKLQQGEKILFIDIRTRAEVEFVGLPTITDANIPYLVNDFEDWDEKKGRFVKVPNSNFPLALKALMKQKGLTETSTIILMCRSGSRSAKAANLLDQLNFKNVYSLVEGFEGEKVKSGNNEGKRRLNGWKNANLPWSYTLDRNKMYFEE
ncbi:MAG: sulfurtransferase [Methylococcales bacterium]|jgi:rhodanese-related sulfurtransferase|nr:sulfurtransferase [Methylococcales bacterium]